MTPLQVAATDRTPKVNFDFAQHLLEIRGESWPEDVESFYGPLFDTLQRYLDAATGRMIAVDLELTYFNSSSAKALMKMFERLEQSSERGNTVVINWYYLPDDEQMKTNGELFAEDLTRVHFKLREAPSSKV